MSTTDTSRPRRYFLFHFYVMRIVGLGWWHHPDEGDTRNFPGWYICYTVFAMLVAVVIFVGMETVDPFIGGVDMDRLMFSLSFVITHNLTVIKLYLLFFKNKDIQKIVYTIEIELRNYYQNEERNRKTIKISKIMSFSFVFFLWMTVVNSYTYGAVQDIQWKGLVKKLKLNGSVEIPPRSLYQPIYIPWNYEEEATYIATFILEVIGILWNIHIVLVIDTFIGSIILHMSAQFETVREAIDTVYDRTITLLFEHAGFNEDEDTSYDKNNVTAKERIVRDFYSEIQIESALQTTLGNCIRQHQILTECVQDFSDIYSYGFLTQLVSSTYAICAIMVQVSYDSSSLKSMKFFISLVFFIAMITQLAIQCFTGNELTLQASLVAESVMRCKWEQMPVRVQAQLVIVMARAQRPLQLSAGGFSSMNNDCFVSIMKAAYSYYAVLNTRQDA